MGRKYKNMLGRQATQYEFNGTSGALTNGDSYSLLSVSRLCGVAKTTLANRMKGKKVLTDDVIQATDGRWSQAQKAQFYSRLETSGMKMADQFIRRKLA